MLQFRKVTLYWEGSHQNTLIWAKRTERRHSAITITIADPTKLIPIIFSLNINLRKNLFVSTNLFGNCRSEKQSTFFPKGVFNLLGLTFWSNYKAEDRSWMFTWKLFMTAYTSTLGFGRKYHSTVWNYRGVCKSFSGTRASWKWGAKEYHKVTPRDLFVRRTIQRLPLNRKKHNRGLGKGEVFYRVLCKHDM